MQSFSSKYFFEKNAIVVLRFRRNLEKLAQWLNNCTKIFPQNKCFLFSFRRKIVEVQGADANIFQPLFVCNKTKTEVLIIKQFTDVLYDKHWQNPFTFSCKSSVMSMYLCAWFLWLYVFSLLANVLLFSELALRYKRVTFRKIEGMWITLPWGVTPDSVGSFGQYG